MEDITADIALKEGMAIEKLGVSEQLIEQPVAKRMTHGAIEVPLYTGYGGYGKQRMQGLGGEIVLITDSDLGGLTVLADGD